MPSIASRIGDKVMNAIDRVRERLNMPEPQSLKKDNDNDNRMSM
jgi:hypothetical protein